MTTSTLTIPATTVSVLELFSIGIGPSSSHTVGPMRASFSFTENIKQQKRLKDVQKVKIELFGSLAMTGIGHATDLAICLGLCGYKPETIDSDQVSSIIAKLKREKKISLGNIHLIDFDYDQDIQFLKGKRLPYHSNAMKFYAYGSNNELLFEETMYSTGGGFVKNHKDIDQENLESSDFKPVPFPYKTAEELLEHCRQNNLSIPELVMQNELAMRSSEEVVEGILKIWSVMQACVKRGIKTQGILPGGLNVKRRAFDLHEKLSLSNQEDPSEIFDWVSLFALAVNEENACGGQVVTAPTNGASGVIPAVLHYYMKFVKGASVEGIIKFFLSATAIGILFKEGASLSAAEMGCQGEVGVACSMAAGGLVAAMGGTNDEIENAAEIGMEHNLGLTCDPIAGLVQIPCIERNTKGAICAINAARLALHNKGDHRVSLDQVIMAMRKTGEDMNSIYKETSEGGLALFVPVNLPEC
jgi:L-serine dehydratase